MFERFTERARQVVVLAQDEARALQHNYIGTEHILLGLLREEEGLAAHVLDSLGLRIDDVRAQVMRIVGLGDEPLSGQIPFTPRSKKVLELSLREALSLGHNYIGTEHILLGLVRENSGVAARILLDYDADSDKIRDQTIRMLSPGGQPLRLEGGGSIGSHRRDAWEYRIEEWGAAEAGERQAALTELGGEGWRLVAVVPNGATSQWVFQRQVVRFVLPRPGAGPRRPAWTAALVKGDPGLPLTVGGLAAGLAGAKEAAQAGDDHERARTIGELEERLTALLATLAEVLQPKQDTELTELTVDGLLRTLVSIKQDEIDGGKFETAAMTRDLERKLRALLSSIANVLSDGGSEPAAPS